MRQSGSERNIGGLDMREPRLPSNGRVLRLATGSETNGNRSTVPYGQPPDYHHITSTENITPGGYSSEEGRATSSEGHSSHLRAQTEPVSPTQQLHSGTFSGLPEV